MLYVYRVYKCSHHWVGQKHKTFVVDEVQFDTTFTQITKFQDMYDAVVRGGPTDSSGPQNDLDIIWFCRNAHVTWDVYCIVELKEDVS